MTPEQFEIFLKSNEIATGKAVEKFVNGKVDVLTLSVNSKMKEMRDMVDAHALEDKKFQERAEPMLKVFKENEIFKMELDKKTGTFTLYARRALTFGALLAGIGAIIKFILMK